MTSKKKEYDRNWRAANREWQRDYDRNLTPEQKKAHQEAKKARKRKFSAEFVGPKRPHSSEPLSPFRKSDEEKRQTKNAARRRQYQRDKAKARAKDAKREAEKSQRTPWHNELDCLAIEEAYNLLTLRKQVTGIDWHVDHMLPLRAETVSGLHVGMNIAVIPAAMNIAKGNQVLYTETGDWLR